VGDAADGVENAVTDSSGMGIWGIVIAIIIIAAIAFLIFAIFGRKK